MARDGTAEQAAVEIACKSRQACTNSHSSSELALSARCSSGRGNSLCCNNLQRWPADPVPSGPALAPLATLMARVRAFAPTVLCLVVLLTARAATQDVVPVPLAERASGSDHVVVGRVTAVEPQWQVNDFGDRLIVSVVRIAVSETLKGGAGTTIEVDIEGGTIGDLTLNVSDQVTMQTGDRAVFYLERSPRGRIVPHLRGQGVIKLDAAGRVPDSGLTLETIRRETAAGRAR